MDQVMIRLIQILIDFQMMVDIMMDCQSLIELYAEVGEEILRRRMSQVMTNISKERM